MLTTLFIYSLGVALSLTVMHVVGTVATRGLTCFALMRRAVLLSVVVSLGLPLLMFVAPDGAQASGAGAAGVLLPGVTVGGTAIADGAGAARFTLHFRPLMDVAAIVWLAGVAVAVASLGWAVMRLRRYLAAGVEVDGSADTFGTPVIVVADSRYAPFSWGGKIAISATDYAASPRMIILHELAHRRKYHWVDLILMAVVCALTWYCPTAWLMRRHIQEIHEYEADQAVIDAGIDRAPYQMMLIKTAAGERFNRLASSFNQSSLYKRITMMLKKRSTGRASWRLLALLPAMALVAAALGNTAVSASVSAMAANVAPAAVSDDTAVTTEKIYEACEVMPEFEGGMPGMMMWLAQNTRYPKEAVDSMYQGRAVVKFVVNSKGKVSQPQIVRSTGYKMLDDEAVRVTGKLPDFKPGTSGGKPVSVWFTVPVTFKLASSPEQK